MKICGLYSLLPKASRRRHERSCPSCRQRATQMERLEQCLRTTAPAFEPERPFLTRRIVASHQAPSSTPAVPRTLPRLAASAVAFSLVGLAILGWRFRSQFETSPGMAALPQLSPAFEWVGKAGYLPSGWTARAQDSLIGEARRTVEDSRYLVASMVKTAIPEGVTEAFLGSAEIRAETPE